MHRDLTKLDRHRADCQKDVDRAMCMISPENRVRDVPATSTVLSPAIDLGSISAVGSHRKLALQQTLSGTSTERHCQRHKSFSKTAYKMETSLQRTKHLTLLHMCACSLLITKGHLDIHTVAGKFAGSSKCHVVCVAPVTIADLQYPHASMFSTIH